MRKYQFFEKFKNTNIDQRELERKYQAHLREQEEQQMLYEAAMRSSSSTSPGAAGGGVVGGPLTFVVDTTDGTYFGMSFTSTGEPITFTIDWGDGTVEEGEGIGGYYEEIHTFPEENTQYTVTISFDDPGKILELDFYGND
jgi:hypothetical protein